MAAPLYEILGKINEDPKSLQKYNQQFGAIRILLEYAYIPEKKFILPDGDPPFKPDVAPLGMTETNLYTELRRLYVFCRKDLKQIQRETMFVSLLEGLTEAEAKMIIAVKDQKLNKIFPKLTRKWAEEAGFIPKVEKPSKTTA